MLRRPWSAFAVLLAACGASPPPATTAVAPSAWASALSSERPFGCTLAPIWAHRVVWPIHEGALAEFAAAHQEETELVTLPDALASQLPSPAQVFVPTTDGLCAATLGPAQLRPDDVIDNVPTFLRAVIGCSEHAAPLALLCPADVHVPTDLHWEPFAWSAITPIADAAPNVQHAMTERAELLEATVRNAATALEGATMVARGRGASVVVGDDEIDAAQLGLAWFDPGIDVETGCPTLEVATGEITTRAGRRLATAISYVGVLHDTRSVVGVVQDTFSVESESCDGEHSCFFVAIATPDAAGLVTRSRAISSFTSGQIEPNSPLRFMDTRAPCNLRDE